MRCSVFCSGLSVSLSLPSSNRLLVHHAPKLTAAIYLIHASGVVQVHLRILRPCVLTETGTIDGCVVFIFLVIIYRCVDVHTAIECAAAVVVAAIETRTVATHDGIATVPVDICLIYVARILLIQSVGTTEDGFCAECRTLRHVDHRASCHALLIATAIDSLELTAQQVDDGRCLVCCLRIVGYAFIYTHAYAATLSGTEYLSLLVGSHGLRCVDEDITSILHQILFVFSQITLSCSVYLFYDIKRILVFYRAEVDEGILKVWFVIAKFCMTIFIEVCTEVRVRIVIHTVCATEYLLYASLYILYVCGGIEHIGIVYLAANCLVAQAAVEVGFVQNLSTEVVTAVYEVTYVGETVDANVCLSVSEDVGITCSGEGVEDSSVVQLDDTVTSHCA